MAGFPAKKEVEAVEPPPFNWRCQDELIFGGADRCRKSLTEAWVAIPLDEDNPTKFARLCVACAKRASDQERIPVIEQLQTIQPRSGAGVWGFVAGVVVMGALALIFLR